MLEEMRLLGRKTSRAEPCKAGSEQVVSLWVEDDITGAMVKEVGGPNGEKTSCGSNDTTEDCDISPVRGKAPEPRLISLVNEKWHRQRGMPGTRRGRLCLVARVSKVGTCREKGEGLEEQSPPTTPELGEKRGRKMS